MPSEVASLKDMIEDMPTFTAPRADYNGNDISYYSLQAIDKTATWTTLSTDVPKGVTGLSAALRQSVQTKATDNPPVVHRIIDVKTTIEKSDPPNLVVTAVGEVKGQGWRDVRLTRYVPFLPPQDGIWEYVLTAVPSANADSGPKGKIEASDRWIAYPSTRVKGVRVFGIGDGKQEVHF